MGGASQLFLRLSKWAGLAGYCSVCLNVWGEPVIAPFVKVGEASRLLVRLSKWAGLAGYWSVCLSGRG